MDIRQIRKRTGLSIPKFAEKYGIPPSTVSGWEYGQGHCPEYVERLLERVVNEDYGYVDPPYPDVEKMKELCDELIRIIRKYE